jgi:hypothetical protein
MTLRITDDTITSDHTAHCARLLPGDQYAWEVSWLSGRLMGRNSAITAMVLADTVGSGAHDRDHRMWPFIEAWTAELRVSVPAALTQISRPPETTNIEKNTEPADPEAAG